MELDVNFYLIYLTMSLFGLCVVLVLYKTLAAAQNFH